MKIGRPRRRTRPAKVLTYTLMIGLWACDGRYAHGRIPVDEQTRKTWDAAEKAVEDTGKKLEPIAPVRGAPDSVPVSSLPGVLAHVYPSMRHGANDKRLLSDTSGGFFVSSKILAEITLVKGSEYKKEDDFRKGWIPIAIINRSPHAGASTLPYPKLNLPDTPQSWVFVRELPDSTWVGALVYRQGGTYAQNRLSVSTVMVDTSKAGKSDTVKVDSLEPVIGARFVWRDDDEIMWAYCGGKCCQMRGIK
jgi:hypothetical protein